MLAAFRMMFAPSRTREQAHARDRDQDHRDLAHAKHAEDCREAVDAEFGR